MKLFGGSKQETQDAGRRRPLSDDRRSTQQSTAFSYYSQRSQEGGNTGRREMIETIDGSQPNRAVSVLSRHRVTIWAATAVILIVAGYLLVLSGTPQIVLLQDKTTAYFLQESGVYQQSAISALGTSLFNKNKLTVDTSAVRLALLQKYPEIKNVSIVMPVFGHNPRIYIEPYKPSFVVTTTANTAYLLDSTGRALVEASQVSEATTLGVPTIQDKTGVDVQIGSRALPSTTVTFAQTVLAALETKDITATSLVLPAAYELDVSIGSTPYFVKFNLQGDALQQVGTFLATKQRLESDKTPAGQYIDVRVPGRAYYK